jgi:hypothetical protein
MLCAIVTTGTVVAGASTVQAPGTALVKSPSSNAGTVEANTTGSRPAWGDVESPFAAATKPNTYGALTGYNPLPQACGNASYATVYNAMHTLVTIGVGQVRCDLNWWTVQPTGPTTFNWAIYDNVVNAAAANGLQILFNVSFTPPWARPNPLPAGTQDPSHVPPKHTNDFVRFAKAAMERYSPKGKQRVSGVIGTVSQWEIWNEPNIVGGWTPPNPVVYGTFLKNVVFGMRQVDKGATIISGGLAPAGDVGGNISPQEFVAGMAKTGVLSKIDGVGMHPYSFPAYPNEQLNFNPIYNAVPATYYVMLLNGAGSKKIWATEVGWPTSSQSSQSYRFWDGIQVGTEAYQAKELPLTVSTWFTLPYAGPLFLYAQQDKCTDNTQWLCKMGIQRTDGSHKPAYATVQAQLRKPLIHH